jgi:hypothetical protein
LLILRLIVSLGPASQEPPTIALQRRSRALRSPYSCSNIASHSLLRHSRGLGQRLERFLLDIFSSRYSRAASRSNKHAASLTRLTWRRPNPWRGGAPHAKISSWISRSASSACCTEHAVASNVEHRPFTRHDSRTEFTPFVPRTVHCQLRHHAGDQCHLHPPAVKFRLAMRNRGRSKRLQRSPSSRRPACRQLASVFYEEGVNNPPKKSLVRGGSRCSKYTLLVLARVGTIAEDSCVLIRAAMRRHIVSFLTPQSIICVTHPHHIIHARPNVTSVTHKQ